MMNFSTMTEQEARDFLSKNRASDLLKRYSPTEINILITRAGKMSSAKPVPAKTIAINHPVQTSFPVIKQNPIADINKTPSITQQAKNLGHAMTEWANGGFHLVSDEVFWQRINICRTCPWWQELGHTAIGRCKKCGCSTAKHKLATSRCPLNPPKWNQHLNR